MLNRAATGITVLLLRYEKQGAVHIIIFKSEIELEVWNAEKRGDFMRAWVTNNWSPADSLPYLKGILKYDLCCKSKALDKL